MSNDMNEINRAIGALQSSVETLTRTWSEQDRKATEGRRELYRKVDELKSEVTEAKGRVAKVAEEIAEVKPAIKRFEAQRQREEGVRSTVKLIWGGVVVFATGLGYAGHELLLWFWPPKH